eukprot:765306-Hanusia_phi.AAC.5
MVSERASERARRAREGEERSECVRDSGRQAGRKEGRKESATISKRTAQVQDEDEEVVAVRKPRDSKRVEASYVRMKGETFQDQVTGGQQGVRRVKARTDEKKGHVEKEPAEENSEGRTREGVVQVQVRQLSLGGGESQGRRGATSRRGAKSGNWWRATCKDKQHLKDRRCREEVGAAVAQATVCRHRCR